MHRDRTAAAAIAVVGCRRERRSRLRRRLATISPNLLANIHTLVRPNRPPTISRVYIRKWMDSGERQRMDRPTNRPTIRRAFSSRAHILYVYIWTHRTISDSLIWWWWWCWLLLLLMLCIGKLFFTLYRARQVVSFRCIMLFHVGSKFDRPMRYSFAYSCVYFVRSVYSSVIVCLCVSTHTDTGDTWQRERTLASLWLHTYTNEYFDRVHMCICQFSNVRPATGPTHSRTQPAHTFSLNLNEHETS